MDRTVGRRPTRIEVIVLVLVFLSLIGAFAHIPGASDFGLLAIGGGAIVRILTERRKYNGIVPIAFWFVLALIVLIWLLLAYEFCRKVVGVAA